MTVRWNDAPVAEFAGKNTQMRIEYTVEMVPAPNSHRKLFHVFCKREEETVSSQLTSFEILSKRSKIIVFLVSQGPETFLMSKKKGKSYEQWDYDVKFSGVESKDVVAWAMVRPFTSVEMMTYIILGYL